MMARTQILLDVEVRRRARNRAGELGISLAEYIRRLIARDLGRPEPTAEPSVVFDLGDSGGSNVAADRDAMTGEAASGRSR